MMTKSPDSSPSGGSSASGGTATARGERRRDAITAAAAELFSQRGYPGVGIDDIGAAAGVTGPAIYRHFTSKAAVLTAVIDAIIDAVAPDHTASETHTAATSKEAPAQDNVIGDAPSTILRSRIRHYAAGVAHRRELMAVFIREVHHLPAEYADQLRRRQRALVTDWRALLTAVHPTWSAERVRTSVHAVFGMLNAVGTFISPLPDEELASQLTELCVAAFELSEGNDLTQ